MKTWQWGNQQHLNSQSWRWWSRIKWMRCVGFLSSFGGSTLSEPFVDTVDITKLAPRKPTWDLKRDLEKKIQKLERRTQRAIAELVAERLRAQANGDLDSQVNAGAVAEQLGAVESDEEE
eukprot:comp21063_c0_seq1/m.28349 comp21063_c0_seq1/g.28349  ORF comp21063_c0_seq1/g.28349 comp21063_c0_seq1/m.28349 type:complete len:120 (-) comp21063_c0_seq1:438-797(-)